LTELLPWELTLLGTGIPGSDEVFLKPHTPDAFWLQRRALALDPNYAPAHASLASSLAYHALFNPPENSQSALAEADRHAQIATALAPYVPEVLYQVANYYRFRGDREKSAEMLRRILEIHPDDIQAGVDLPFVEGHCRPSAGAAVSRLLAIERGLSPANPIRRVVLSHLADIYLSEGQFGLARDAGARSRNIVQNAWSGITLAAALAQLGMVAEARQISAETKREWPNLDYGLFADHTLPLWCFGSSHTAAARAAFRALDRLEKLPK
jgi:tetratricopeptide (TPR) repeat protein